MRVKARDRYAHCTCQEVHRVVTTIRPKVAYFSMEIALDPKIPTFAGGLGILAGDTLRSAADLNLPVAGISLVHHKGYFRQRLDANGKQRAEADEWTPSDLTDAVEPRVQVVIEGRTVHVRAWRYSMHGRNGHYVPVYLLDTSPPENTEFDRSLTDSLYLGDDHYRLCQEAILGIGGVRMLRALHQSGIENYHMNEGHSALLALELLQEEIASRGGAYSDEAMDAVRRKCIFTTHTPVPAGHDRFPAEMAAQVLGTEAADLLKTSRCCEDHTLNMTYLALRCSHYINGVAMHHAEISRGMYPRYPINAITNGVHAVTWVSAPFQVLFDRHIPDWRRDNNYLRYALSIPIEEVWRAHCAAKKTLLDEIQQVTSVRLEADVLTIGFARRATAYKRADLFFHDLDRLRHIAKEVGPFQVVMAGKAHPQDTGGQDLIQRVFQAAESLRDAVKIVYVEDYDMRWAQRLTSGVDLWLNTPKRPREASGTSGMKAALNGVPSFSVLDGWWIEGHIEGVTGWSIGEDGGSGDDDAADAGFLYNKLDRVILPLYRAEQDGYTKVMRSAIAFNGAFFNTQRMVSQYAVNAYFPDDGQPLIR